MNNKIKFSRIKKLVLSVMITAILVCATPLSPLAAVLPTAVNTEAATSSVNYSKNENWAYWSVGDKDIDLFLICPTVYKSNDTLNMPLQDEKQRQRFINALNMERGIYEDSCRMFAPFYRQAAFSVYAMGASEADIYFDLAYADIRAAFMYYMENYNAGRPFVLAGFSQGSDMALRLMKEFFDDESVCERLVAAYVIGWRVTPEDLAAFPFLKMAEREDDTGVIVSFNTEAENVEYSIIVPDTTFGINPLNWRTDEAYASKEMNKGACFPSSNGEIESEISELTGAYLDPERGTLKVTDVSPGDYPPVLDIFEEGVYHIYDYQFFYRNLQENVAVRANAFKNHRDADKWYSESVSFVYANGIMRDAGDGSSAPDAPVTKVMAYQAICKMLDNWHYDSEVWTRNTGIADGENYDSENAMSRAELVVTLSSLIDYIGMVQTPVDTTGFTDSDDIPDYAAEGFRNAVGAGIVRGYGGALMPNHIVTRAELAQMLYNVSKLRQLKGI